MSERLFEGCRILVVEDEYLIADELRDALQDEGAEVIGPAPDVPAAMTLLRGERRIDGALLDINLRGVMVFDVADALRDRGVPFAFATGYDRWAIPDRFAEVPRLEKPVKARQVTAILSPMLG